MIHADFFQKKVKKKEGACGLACLDMDRYLRTTVKCFMLVNVHCDII